MNDSNPDAMTALYRRHAREAPAPDIDARILAMAHNTKTQTAGRHRWVWASVPIAAVLALWFVTPHITPVVASPPAYSMHGYDEGRTQAYLLGMDISPPTSPVADALLHQPTSH